MYALAEALKVPLALAVGTMEMLWHFAGTNTPEGDIGRLTDLEIAAAVAWDKKPEVLMKALVGAGWLDQNEKYRLLIHDWPQHCDQAVRKTLIYRRRSFLPVYGELSSPVVDVPPEVPPEKPPDVCREDSPPSGTATASVGFVGLKASTENKTPTRARALAPIERPTIEEIFDECDSVYRQAGVPISPKHKQLILQYLSEVPASKRQRVPNYCKWCLAMGRWKGVATTKALLNVLRDGDWDVELVERTLPNAPGALSRADASREEGNRLFRERHPEIL